MAPTPRPSDWQGGREDFGFLRTLDGHIAADKTTPKKERDNFGYANVRWGFERADLSGDYDTALDAATPDVHTADLIGD
jgi:hypothetical protein